jgi:hypothetical protein
VEQVEGAPVVAVGTSSEVLEFCDGCGSNLSKELKQPPHTSALNGATNLNERGACTLHN